MLLVLARNCAREIRPFEVFHDAIEVRTKVLHVPTHFLSDSACVTGYLLLALNVVVEQERLDGDVTKKETEAHVELRCLEVDILLPNRTCFHVLAHALDGSLKNLFDLVVCILSNNLTVILKEGKIAVPEVDLGGVVAQGVLKDLLCLRDGFATDASVLASVLTSIVLTWLTRDEQSNVSGEIVRI